MNVFSTESIEHEFVVVLITCYTFHFELMDIFCKFILRTILYKKVVLAM